MGEIPADATIVMPIRRLYIGGLNVSVSPGIAPVEITEDPKGVTAKVGRVYPPDYVPSLRVRQAEPLQTPSAFLLGGEGKAVVIVGPNVQAKANTPGRTNENTLLHILPGADVTRPQSNAVSKKP